MSHLDGDNKLFTVLPQKNIQHIYSQLTLKLFKFNIVHIRVYIRNIYYNIDYVVDIP